MREATTQAILTAAKKLIIANGYTGTTSKAIAAEAGISEMTLFRTFKQKQDIVHYALQNELWFPSFDDILLVPTKEPLELQLHRIARALCEKLDEDYLRLLIGLRAPEIFPKIRHEITGMPAFQKRLSIFFQPYSATPTVYAEIFLSGFFGWLFAQVSYENNFYTSTLPIFTNQFILLFTTSLSATQSN